MAVAPGEPHRGFGRELIEVDPPHELDAETRFDLPDGGSRVIEVMLGPRPA